MSHQTITETELDVVSCPLCKARYDVNRASYECPSCANGYFDALREVWSDKYDTKQQREFVKIRSESLIERGDHDSQDSILGRFRRGVGT